MTASSELSWLDRALANRRASRKSGPPRVADEQALPAVGELRVLQHMDLGTAADRLGLVVGVDQRLAAAHVLLASPLVEYRTAVDYMLDPAESSAPMPLIVECDVRGAVWFAQLGARVGHVEPVLAERLDRIGAGAVPVSVGLELSGFGLPARDDRDPRWAWKLTELDALNALTSECDEWLLSDELCPGVVDPALFDELTDLTDLPSELTEAALTLREAHDVYDAWVSEGALNSLGEMLDRADPDVGAALAPLLEGALSRLDVMPQKVPSELSWAGRQERTKADSLRLAQAVAMRASPTDRCVVVVTSRRTWGATKAVGLAPAVVCVAGERRVQVRPLDLHCRDSEVTA